MAGVVTALAMAGTTTTAEAKSARQDQWYLDAWKMEEAWAISQGQGVTVAVVDSGVDGTLADLAGQTLPGPLGDGATDNHGTAMASLIAGTGRGEGGQGVMGVAPKAKILPLKMSVSAGGTFAGQDIASAIRLAADSNAKIINLSLGSQELPNPLETTAISYAVSKGKLVVAGSGNADKRRGIGPTYPASYPGVLGVGGHDRNGTVWSGALTGRWVSLAAPSVDQVTSCRGPAGEEGYCDGEGTSGATALVSGVAALVWSAHPDWTANQVIKRLIDTANPPQSGPVPNDYLGYGNVSPRKALQSTAPPGPPDINPLLGNRGDPLTAESPQPSTSPSPSASAPGTTPPASPNPSQVGNAIEKPDGGDSNNNTLLIAAVAAAGAVLLAALTFIALRTRKSTSSPPPPPGYF